MTLDIEVKKGINRGLISGALASPFMVFYTKMRDTIEANPRYYLENVIVEEESSWSNAYNIISDTVQRLGENPSGTVSALALVPIILATVCGAMGYFNSGNQEKN